MCVCVQVAIALIKAGPPVTVTCVRHGTTLLISNCQSKAPIAGNHFFGQWHTPSLSSTAF